MKKIITLILSLCLCAVANAQIQTKFWGLELSHYYSLEDAKETISDRCQYASIEDNVINAITGSFGGMNWEFITFSFIKGNYYFGLCDVLFSNHFNTRNAAMDRFSLLLNTLNDKYGVSDGYKDEYEKTCHFWKSEDNPSRCLLELTKSESNGGEEYWYVNLNYYDIDLLNKRYDQLSSEL